MKIAIPVSASDKHLLPNFTAVIQHLGGFGEHQAIFFATLSASEEAHHAANALGASVHVFDRDFPDGWPNACSNHFACTVLRLGANGNTDPFLWMELDMLPVKEGWASALEREYRQLGSPFLGNVVPLMYTDGNVLKQREGETMMMGCGVYAPGMEKDERFKPLLLDLAKTGTRCPREPFDVYLRYSILNTGRANTSLIADMWQTRNYRREDGLLVCDSVKHDKPVRERGGVVPAGVVLVHGCKDDSLAKLVLGDEGVPVVPQTVTVSTGAGDVEDDEDWLGGSSNEEATTTTVSTGAEETQPEKTEEPEQPAIDPKLAAITRDDIIKAMGGRKMRYGALAKILKVSPTKLLTTVFPRQGFTAATSGWVQSTL